MLLSDQYYVNINHIHIHDDLHLNDLHLHLNDDDIRVCLGRRPDLHRNYL